MIHLNKYTRNYLTSSTFLLKTNKSIIKISKPLLSTMFNRQMHHTQSVVNKFANMSLNNIIPHIRNYANYCVHTP